MNYSTAVFVINSKIMAILATYEDGQKKTMFKTLDQSIAPGDLVVVPTDTRHKMTVVKVTDVRVNIDLDDPTPVAWVVNKVDKEGFDALLKQEVHAIEVIKSAEFKKRRDEMRDAITANAEELKALPIYANGK
jgi:hypothetical protein